MATEKNYHKSNQNAKNPSEIFTVENAIVTKKSPGNLNLFKECAESVQYNPFSERRPEHPNTDIDAFIHLIKSSLGSGLLAIPMAFKNGGLIFGIVGTIITGIVCTHCVQILVASSHVLCKRAKCPSLGYSKTAELALELGPPKLRKLAGAAGFIVNFLLVLTYFGGNCVYIYFISRSLMDVIDHNVENLDLNLQDYMFMLLLLLIPLCQIRQLKYLVPFSGIANCCMIVALGITFYYLFDDIQSPMDRTAIGRIENMPIFFSTVIFAMEGIGVVMPLENSMKTPQHFLGCPGVLNTAMIVITFLYTTMGFFGYLKYPEIDDSITSEIPLDTIPGQIVRILIAITILFTYALQFFAPLAIVWSSTKKCVPKKFHNVAEMVVRTMLVVATVIVTSLAANLETLVGFVGAVCFSNLGILIPCIIETVVCWESKTLGRLYWKLIKNILLSLFAIMTLLSGSRSSIQKLIQFYSSG